jgi:hypothetical protein
MTTIQKMLAGVCVGALTAALVTPASAQAQRGKAELKSGSATIDIDYGRPSLKGRDMLSQLKEGSFWRMGMNEATVLTTPVDLTFGATKITKGSYSLWLKKTGESYDLVFNSQTGQWGTQHDPAKDVASVAMKSTSLSSPVETFTMELTPAPSGGQLNLSWGTTRLSAPFERGK